MIEVIGFKRRVECKRVDGVGTGKWRRASQKRNAPNCQHDGTVASHEPETQVLTGNK